MGIADRISRLLKEGYSVDIGEHRMSKGFYVTVYPSDDELCTECESCCPQSWTESGHGWTILEALVAAEAVTKGLASPLNVGVFV
jgi:hypothetical protein